MNLRGNRRIFAVCAGLLTALGILVPRISQAQNNGFFQQAIGGVSVSTDGVLAQAVKTEQALRKEALFKLHKVPTGLKDPVGLRMVSLRAIEEAVAKAVADNAPSLPDEVRYLAGMQRVQYIFVYPETSDIVLAGPGEGWKIDESGNVVGLTTGRPVLQLEDLILALRTVDNARQGGITVSIDPTEEGRLQLDRLVASRPQFSQAILDAIEKALGPQKISITGVPDTSRFARTLVASDYKMKRIAMKLDPSPVKGLGSYLDMLTSAPKNMMPRWWMACDYEPLAKSPDGLAWELRGRGVKVLTEDEIIEGGKVSGSGKTSAAAQKWADTMTAKYEELCVAEPVFGELRNTMDLCVIAAVIAKENLLGQANLEIPTLAGKDSKLAVSEGAAPKTVDTQCSAKHRGREFIITASGGVEINSWAIADKTVENESVSAVRQKATAKTGKELYW